MVRRTDAQILADLEKKQNQIAAKIADKKAKLKGEARKKDTRRKVIAGAIALEHAEKNADFGKVLNDLLGKHVTRPTDRELFDL